MYKFLLIIALFWMPRVQGQELRGRVNVNTSRVSSKVSPAVFKTLESALNDFVNTRKWSSDNFKPSERIDCSFLLNIASSGDDDVYKASLTIQSARPVFNSAYLSPMINYQDNGITFKYAQFQQLEFSDTRVTGSDPLASNLTATFAYWINIILGFDYDSYASRGGNPYFLKAQNIVNNAPEGRGISGWKAFDGTQNRYWLAENLLNSRYTLFHDALYTYYRKGMDQMYQSEIAGRSQILQALNQLYTMDEANSNTMLIPFFFQARSNELISIFSKAQPAEKTKALDLLQKLDPSKASQYKEQLK